MAMVDVDGGSHLSTDSQPKSVGLVWGLAATWRSVCIHQMNWVNSRSDHGHEDSTVNIVVDCCYYIIIIVIIWTAYNTWFLGPIWAHNPKGSWSVLPFLHRWPKSVPILYNGPPFPLKIAPSHGDLDPYLIHCSLGAPESSTQTACRSVQRFFQASLVWQTDRPTDRPRYSVGHNIPHLHVCT